MALDPHHQCRRTPSQGIQAPYQDQIVLPSTETAAKLFWALLASGPIAMRKVDGWQTLATEPTDAVIDLAAPPVSLKLPETPIAAIPSTLQTAPEATRMQPTRWFRFTMLALATAGAICACLSAAVAEDAVPEATYQYSTINALLQGYYDGELTLGELARHGDVGLGTTNGLDGELIILDGAFYQARTDGTVNRLPDSTRTPFAIVSPFKADRQIELPAGLDIDALYRLIDSAIDNRNLYQTIRIDGTFPAVTVRSVPAQTPPYRPLVEVVKQQVIFSYENVKGTLIGFRAPDFLAGINVPGYHFHFISDDRQQGGHLLGITTGESTIGIDQIAAFDVQLPESAGFGALSLSGGRKQELDAAEKQRH